MYLILPSSKKKNKNKHLRVFASVIAFSWYTKKINTPAFSPIISTPFLFPFLGLTSFHSRLLHQTLQGNTCSTTAFTTSCKGISALVPAVPPPPCFTGLYINWAVPHFFTLFFYTCAVFCPFLSTFHPRWPYLCCGLSHDL